MVSINDEINFGVIKRFCKKYLCWILVISFIVGLGSTFIYRQVHVSQYRASSLLVQDDNNYSLVQSYDQILESNQIHKLVGEKVSQSEWKSYGGKEDYTLSLVPKSSTSSFFTISVISKSKGFTKFLTKTVADVFVQNSRSFLKNSNVKIVSTAYTPEVISQKSSIIKVALASFIGVAAVLSVLSVYLMIWSGKIKDEEYVADMYHLDFIGTLESK